MTAQQLLEALQKAIALNPRVADEVVSVEALKQFNFEEFSDVEVTNLKRRHDGSRHWLSIEVDELDG